MSVAQCWLLIGSYQVVFFFFVSVCSSTSPPALNYGADVNARPYRETDSYWPIDGRIKYSPIKLKGGPVETTKCL